MHEALLSDVHSKLTEFANVGFLVVLFVPWINDPGHFNGRPQRLRVNSSMGTLCIANGSF